MAQTNYTPIQIYYSTTAAAVPAAGNLVAGELAINTADELLYFKNSSGTVKSIAATTSLETERAITANTTTTAINLANGDNATIFKVTMSSNTTITFSNPPGGSTNVFTFSLITVNDATAGRSLAFGNTIKWSGGILPPRTTTANAIDVWTFFVENGVYYGSLSVIDAK